MDSPADTPYGVGCPIRTSTDQRPLAAPRGFSQRATSFIASWCQGIHRMPFSYSTRPRAQEPSTPGNTGHGRARPTKDRRFAHTLTLVQTPLNTPVARGGATARTPKGHGRTTRSDERRDRRRTHPGPHPHPPERTSRTRGRDTPRCPARPGTHQNPIHLSKEPAPHTGCHTGRGRRPTPWGRSHRTRTSTPPHSRGGAPIRHTRARVRGADTSRDDAAPTHPRTRVETAGFEPATPCLQSRCSPG